MLTRAQEKVSVTPTRTEPDLPVRAQASPSEAWVSNDCTNYEGPGRGSMLA